MTDVQTRQKRVGLQTIGRFDVQRRRQWKVVGLASMKLLLEGQILCRPLASRDDTPRGCERPAADVKERSQVK